MKYEFYPFLTDYVTRAVRKAHHGNKKTWTTKEAITTMVDEYPNQFFLSSDFHILTEEHAWLKSERVIIYPESIELLNHLFNAKFIGKLTKEAFAPKTKSFIICWPKGFSLLGQKVESCLVDVRPFFELCHQVKLGFCRDFDLGDVAFDLGDQVPEGFDDNELVISLNYVGKPSPKWAKMNPAGCRVRFYEPSSRFVQSLKIENETDFADYVGSLKDEGTTPLDQTETRFQMQLTRLVASILLYCQANPDALKTGFPGENKPKDKSFRLSVPHTLSDQGAPKVEGNSKAGHYRSFCLRQLRHERYYQGPWANHVPGSRIVFVKDTMVGLKDVEAKTLMEEGMEAVE